MPPLDQLSSESKPPRLRLYTVARHGFGTVPHRGRLLWGALIALACCPATIWLDASAARWIDRRPLPGDMTKAVELSEVFAHGVGMICILIGVGALAPRLRWSLPRLATLAFGGGAIATLVKLVVIRPRPQMFRNSELIDAAAWRWSFDFGLNQIAVYEASWRSFPSGHTASAIGFAIGLSLLVPRGRWYFLFLAVLASAQRLHCGAHYFSDVVAGVGIGLAWCYVCLHPRLLGALFDHMEPFEPAATAPEPAARAPRRAA